MKSILAAWFAGAAVSLVTASAGAIAQSADTQVKIGDWVMMRQADKGFTLNLKETLTAKEAATATIKVELSVGDESQPAKEVTMPLNQLRDPLKWAARTPHAKVEKLKSGQEVLTINGKTIACDWMELKVSFDSGGRTIDSTSKIWASTLVPLSGVVRMDNEINGVKTTMELVDYGRGK